MHSVLNKALLKTLA